MNRLQFLKIIGMTAVGAAVAPEMLASKTSNITHIEPNLKDLSLEPDTPRQITAVILGAGSRGNTYATYSKQFPEALKIVGVAEKNPVRMENFVKKYGIEPEYQFKDWKDALKKSKMADAVIISLPDDLHYQPCMDALNKGYDILLEKPIAPTQKECENIRDLAVKKGAIVGVCHVLRYAPYFLAMKKVIDSGQIGKLVSIQHLEPIQYAHMAHSYVRGNWHNSKKTTPIILAKSCHDLDIIRWMVDSPCKSITAYGSLSYFTPENKPAGATARCHEGCPHESTCAYSALDIYTRKHRHLNVFDNLPKKDPERNEVIKEYLKTTDYGRCVFDMDNDQPDHYVASMEFENGVTASFSMEAFMAAGGRRTRVMGTKGEIDGDMSKFVVTDFLTGKKQTWDANHVKEVTAYAGHGHGGGDLALVRDWVSAIGNRDASRLSSDVTVSTESHIMGFAAEKSRLNKSNEPIA